MRSGWGDPREGGDGMRSTVMTKIARDILERTLRERFGALLSTIQGRDLSSPGEGAGKGTWRTPNDLCALVGTSLDLRLAVADFSAILAEIRKLGS